jgi:MFS family permease
MKSHKTIGFHYGYVIVGCCFLIMFVIVGLVMSCAGIFYKPVSEELGVDVGKFGLYMSLNFLLSTLTLSFAGKLLEKYSARVILTLCSAMIAATFMMMSLFSAVWQFYVTVFGIMLAFLLYLGFPTLLNRWFKTRMGFLSVFAVPVPVSGAYCSIRWRDSLLRNMAGA